MSASDAEYFAEICRDLAQSLQSEAGRTACEAQDEVEYIVCDMADGRWHITYDDGWCIVCDEWCVMYHRWRKMDGTCKMMDAM